MNLQQLQNALLARPGSQFVSFVTETVPTMRKTNNPYYGRVTKRATINGLINFNYENSVNNQRLREEKVADFKALARTWGAHVGDTPLINKDGTLYVNVKVQSVKDVVYLLDGKPVSGNLVEAIKDFCPSKGGTRQDVDKEVVVRTYKLDSIVRATINGVTLE